MTDLTVVYYSAMNLPVKFADSMRVNLGKVIGNTPIIMITQSKEIPRFHIQIYRNALEGAKQAKTRYIALAEDDILYSPDHFNFRPSDGKFGYNMCVWNIFTWTQPAVFNYKGRRNLSGLICERDLFIEAMEERFAKWPNDAETPIRNWSEPGKYEENLGVTVRQTELFYSETPNIAFTHETALGFLNLGKRKKMGEIKAIEIPYWGRAEEILKLYE